MVNKMQIPVHGLGNPAGSEPAFLSWATLNPPSFPAVTLEFSCFHQDAKVFPTTRAFKLGVALLFSRFQLLAPLKGLYDHLI